MVFLLEDSVYKNTPFKHLRGHWQAETALEELRNYELFRKAQHVTYKELT